MVAKYGPDHMRRIGSRGGKKTVERHGSFHMRMLGLKGAFNLWAKYKLMPVDQSYFILVNRETGETRGGRRR